MLVSPEKRVLWRLDLRATHGLTREAGDPWWYARDGRSLYGSAVHRDGRRGFWAVPVSGGPARQVVAADDPALRFFFGWSSVGRDRLYAAVSEYESDIWVAKLKW